MPSWKWRKRWNETRNVTASKFPPFRFSFLSFILSFFFFHFLFLFHFLSFSASSRFWYFSFRQFSSSSWLLRMQRIFERFGNLGLFKQYVIAQYCKLHSACLRSMWRALKAHRVIKILSPPFFCVYLQFHRCIGCFLKRFSVNLRRKCQKNWRWPSR